MGGVWHLAGGGGFDSYQSFASQGVDDDVGVWVPHGGQGAPLASHGEMIPRDHGGWMVSEIFLQGPIDPLPMSVAVLAQDHAAGVADPGEFRVVPPLGGGRRG